MTTALWLLGGIVLLTLLNRLVILTFWHDTDEMKFVDVEIYEEITYQASGIVPGGVSWVEQVSAKPVRRQGISE